MTDDVCGAQVIMCAEHYIALDCDLPEGHDGPHSETNLAEVAPYDTQMLRYTWEPVDAK
jgi:hypothetical protein